MGKVILLSGKAGSGKDSAANYLVQYYGYKRIGLADILKEICSEQFGIPLIYFHDRDLKDSPVEFELHGLLIKDKTPRDILIAYGTGLCRALKDDFWLTKVVDKIKHMNKVVISDVRFPNELTTLKAECDATSINLIRVNNPLPVIDSPTEHLLDNHAFDEVIIAEDLEELFTGLDTIMKLRKIYRRDPTI